MPVSRSGMAPEGMDPPRRSTRLVPMVLPVPHGATNAGRGRSADQTLEGNPPSCASASACVRAGRCLVPEAATAGAAALGLRQPQAVRKPRIPRSAQVMHRNSVPTCGRSPSGPLRSHRIGVRHWRPRGSPTGVADPSRRCTVRRHPENGGTRPYPPSHRATCMGRIRRDVQARFGATGPVRQTQGRYQRLRRSVLSAPGARCGLKRREIGFHEFWARKERRHRLVKKLVFLNKCVAQELRRRVRRP
jgi:hypothetical protein